MINYELLQQLLQSEKEDRPVESLTPAMKLETVEDAYKTADAYVSSLGADFAGWKIGASGPVGQERFGLEAPLAGRILEGTIFESPASVPAGGMPWLVEAEISFRLAHRVDTETMDERAIVEYVDVAFPSIELVRVRYADLDEAGGLGVIAANAMSGGLVVGTPQQEWEIDELLDQKISLYKNGELQVEGRVDEADFNPLAALTWLANHSIRRGDPVQAGQVIATGSLLGAVRAAKGDQFTASYGRLGEVQVTLT